MTTAVLDVTAEHLELAAGSAPPCDAWVNRLGVQCRAPSDVRVRVTCPCGMAAVVFLCIPDYWKLKDGNANCGVCGAGPLSEWAET